MHVAASWAENVKNVNRIHLHVVHVTALAPKIKESWRFFSIKHRIVPFAKCPHCRQRCMPSLQSCRTRRQWICPQPCTGYPRSKEELNPMKHTRNTARFVLSLRTNDLTTPSMLFYSTQRHHIPFSTFHAHPQMLSIEFFKSADIPAFERRQEALLGRLQHLQGSVQKLRESVGLADSSTREVSNHVSGSNFLALHIYWQLERGQKILLGMLSLKLHRSNSFNLIYMQSCANNAFTSIEQH